MALRTNLDFKSFFGRAGFKAVPACAGNKGFIIGRVNVLFHRRKVTIKPKKKQGRRQSNLLALGITCLGYSSNSDFLSFLSFVGHRGLRFQRAQPLLPRRRYSDPSIGDQASDACESPSKGQKLKKSHAFTLWLLALALEGLQKPRWARSLRRTSESHRGEGEVRLTAGVRRHCTREG